MAFQAAADESASDIARKARERGGISLAGVTAQLKLTTVEKDGTRREQVLLSSSRRVGERLRSMTRFLSPPGVAGVSVLTIEGDAQQGDDVELYLPKLKRVRKVARAQRGESFMQTDFNYADLANTGGATDDAFRREEDAVIDGRACFVIAGDAGASSPYGPIRLFADKETFVPLKVEYGDKAGKPFKVYRSLQLKRFKERVLSAHSSMENLQTGSRTEMTIERIEDSKLGDDDFTERALERG